MAAETLLPQNGQNLAVKCLRLVRGGGACRAGLLDFRIEKCIHGMAFMWRLGRRILLHPLFGRIMSLLPKRITRPRSRKTACIIKTGQRGFDCDQRWLDLGICQSKTRLVGRMEDGKRIPTL